MMLRPDSSLSQLSNLSLNGKGPCVAHELGMNISQTVDARLTVEVQRRYWARWNERNKEAIDTYNARIEREGLPLAKYRTFLRGR